ncbi:MAG: shikimate kinase [Candidatus Omnitrophica bacterium]|nr:shikimate kinase [Candidatus Omnitrophota bacterium]MBU1871411.1 shikimate kinase [Candidatus Omnitrophota bacterium]
MPVKDKNIYIVGFMGTGKTVVAKEVARQSGRQFIDLDSLIEKEEKKKISQIFAQEGEAHFRMLEKEALHKAAALNKAVIACGGGIVLDKENIRIIKESGLMVCLTAKAGVIISRTSGKSHRPLLNVDNPAQKINDLLAERAPFYAQADFHIDTSDLTIKEVVEKVLEYAG